MKKAMMLIQRNKNIVLWLCFLLVFSGSYAQTTINAVSNKGTILPMSSDPEVKTGALRDAYGNLKANNLINTFFSSVSSGTPLVLSAASAQNQEFTGSVAQTVTLPDATGLVAGFSFNIINNSSTTMTVNSHVGGLVVSIPALNKAVVVLNTASVWTAHLSSVTANLTGPVTSVGNATTIANAAVTYNKIQNVSATDKVLGRVSAGEGVVEEISTTGSGNVVRATSPILETPILGVATGTSLNVSGQLTSTIATGTAPLVVTSTTPVANLSIGGNAETATTATNAISATSATTSTNLALGSGGTIPYQSAAGITEMLANGTAGQVLQSNGTTLAPTWVNAAIGDMTLAAVQTVTGAKTFGAVGDVGKLVIAGSTSGTTILNANATAGSGTVVLPTTGILSTLAGAETFTNKTLTSPTLVTPVIKGSGAGLTTFASSNTLPTTLTMPATSGTIALASSVNNLSYKNPIVTTNVSPADAVTPIGTSLFNYYTFAAQINDIEFLAPAGGSDGNSLIFKVKNLNLGFTIAIILDPTYGGGVSTTKTISTDSTMIIQFMFNSTDSRWDLINLVTLAN